MPFFTSPAEHDETPCAHREQVPIMGQDANGNPTTIGAECRGCDQTW